MPEDWSAPEVAATVADYLAMLEHELRGEPFNKKEHNRRLQALLNGRSAGAIEFKHQNISAVMIELGFPYVDGYKPRRNYQELLRTEIIAQLSGNTELERVTEAAVEAPATPATLAADSADLFVQAPRREVGKFRYERQTRATVPRQIDYSNERHGIGLSVRPANSSHSTPSTAACGTLGRGISPKRSSTFPLPRAMASVTISSYSTSTAASDSSR